MQPVQPLLLLLLLTIFCFSTVAASSSCDAVAFVKSTCNSTRYPDLCDQVSLPYATHIKCNFQKMSGYSLKATLRVAKNSSTTISKISSEKGAVKDCVDLVKDGVDQINDSIAELKALKNASSDGVRRFKLSNIETWMSAALTDYQTCLDGLDEQEVRESIKRIITDSIQYSSMHSSNSLSIINKIQ